MAKITVNTDSFFFAHGKMPRGRGWWLFWLTTEDRCRVAEFEVTGLYSDALAAAKAHARVNGYSEIVVCS
jgi:hypothetical protein